MDLSTSAKACLQEALQNITFVCPVCKAESPIQPPFNLAEFNCPVCTKHAHPFVRFGDQVVDLVHLRGLIASLYLNAPLARSVLELLRSSSYRAAPLDPQIPRRVVAAHTVVACVSHAGPRIPWYGVLLGAVYPSVTAAAPFVAWSVMSHGLRERTVNMIEGPLSLAAFDPTEVPEVRNENRLAARVLERLVAQPPAPEIIFETDPDRFDGFGSLESQWSILIDTGKRLKDHTDSPDVPDLGEFRRQVAERVAGVVAEPSEVSCRVRRALLVRGKLPPNHPLLHHGKPDQTLSDDQVQRLVGDPRVASSTESSTVVESFDFRFGRIIRTCLSADRTGRYVTIRWFTYATRPVFPGAYLDSHLIDPDDAVLQRDERKATAKVSGFLGGLERAMPPRLGLWLIGIPLFGGAWFLLVNSAMEMGGLGPVEERVLYLALATTLAFVVWGAKRHPFPTSVLEEEEMQRQFRTQRRIEEAVDEVRRRFGRWSYGALRSVGISFGAQVKEDRLSRQRGEFLVYAHNRAVQDAIVHVAEELGIDMSEFKEGIAQFNNYGVISNQGVVAGSVSGPVAVGAGSVAQQTGAGVKQPRRPRTQPGRPREQAAHGGTRA